MTVEVRNNVGVSEIPTAGQEICHDVSRARNVVMQWNVTVPALVESLQTEEERRGTRGGGGAFALPVHGRGIIVRIVHGAFGHVSEASENVVLGNGPREFQVTVGDVACRVIKGHETLADSNGKGFPPQNWGDNTVVIGDKVNPPHACSGGVTRTEGGRVDVWNHFGYAGWSAGNIGGQEPKVL